MTQFISKPSDNLWMLVIVQRANGQLTMIPMDVPIELHRKIEQLLRTELHKPVEQVLGV